MVAINRVTKVVKGGKNMSFSALVVIGDPSAKVVGYGVGKAKEVPSAIRKGIEAAKKNAAPDQRARNHHSAPGAGQVSRSSQVLLKPAPAGTGVIAGGAVRAVITACGIPNVLTKSIGRRNAAQRGEGDHRGAGIAARQKPGGGDARPGGGETLMARHDNQNQTGAQPHLHARKAQAGGQGLGLRKLNQIVVRPDTPVFRGMVKKVPHLLEVVE